MPSNEKETTQTRVRRRGSWQLSRDTEGNDETVNKFTMFAIGTAAFLVGFWALACLAKAFFQDGPLNILRQLTAAIAG